MRPTQIKLTRDQLDAIPKHKPAPGEPNMALLGYPVELVDRVEDSTPYELWLAKHREQGYTIVRFGGQDIAVKPPTELPVWRPGIDDLDGIFDGQERTP